MDQNRSRSDSRTASSSSVPAAASSRYQSASATASFVHKYKLVFLGDQSVGKTSLITRFMYDSFDTNYQATIGIDFLSKTLYLEDRTIRLQLWDTAGQERFRTLIPSYIRDAAVTVIVYDITCASSFSSVDQWVADVREERGESMEDVILVLVGNKADCSESERQVATQEGEEKARQLGVRIFMETSAKSGMNVKAVFMKIAATLPVAEPPNADSAKGGASQLIDVRLSGEPNMGNQQSRCAC